MLRWPAVSHADVHGQSMRGMYIHSHAHAWYTNRHADTIARAEREVVHQ